MSDSEGNDAEDRVIIEQMLLKIEEVFVYRIPPMRSADGHRAEDWNLAKPLATCSLIVVRRDNNLCINIMAERPKPGAPAGAMENYEFAQSNIRVDLTNPSHKIEHWVNPVVDSSRYFALRIKDSKTGREAFIGVGFRERTDATNLRMSIEDYINSLKREDKAAALRKKFEESLSLGDQSSKDGGHDADGENLPIAKSSLTLKEGEKLHINIKNKRVNPNIKNKRVNPVDKQSPKVKGTGGMIGLKKPPPPPNAAPASDNSDDQGSTANSTTAADVDWGDFEG